MKKYREYKTLDLTLTAREVLARWEQDDVFRRSIESREGRTPFVFYEGPPSANGMPGIHHVMARAIKDIFCRYKTLKGFQVHRKAGWDTHGLPIELGVEKELGITKEDIGKTISIEAYNEACRKAVMKYTGLWNDLTRKMGYWVDMDHPYVTYDNKYIETVWWLLRRIYDKNLLYKGYTIQPYSPAAGTGLSSHELNQPGCYREVTDNTVVAVFGLLPEAKEKLQQQMGIELPEATGFLAWTTTPWTLPSNTALAVGKNIPYALVKTYNPYTLEPCVVILAEATLPQYFKPENRLELQDWNTRQPETKSIPWAPLATLTGAQLTGLRYAQLLPYALPHENPEQAFRVIPGDFVTTDDGTGIVHIAPTFGADDMRVAREAGVPPMLVADEQGVPRPLVDLQGRFVKQMGELAGKFVKNEYYPAGEAPDKSVDVEIIIRLKTEGKAFDARKYPHSYPHCWRTDKPILYYPLDSWFIRIPEVRERMTALNKTIRWKPESTGTGRFGNWLENANDWNLSRSRYWGIPLPIWRSEDGEEKCIGSVEELKAECEKAVAAGLMAENPLKDFQPGNFSAANYTTFDLHRPYTDDIVLLSDSGKPMRRETDLIDVWFDSGAMPYAQLHYPFENKELIDAHKAFPADFIAEGVDQTRGWFYTLHAIATLCFDSVAYKNVVSNGLVLDKNGQKMSKRLGNAVDPFSTLEQYGADATRWYMITNAQPWDNLKFDAEGITETQRKFFRALHNTYAFFALYANVDGFTHREPEVPLAQRPEIDRWILSRLNSLIRVVDQSLSDYEPTRAGREIESFVLDDLSNWYVRLCRRRFWKGEYTEDKIAAYQTLYRCLETVALLAAPIAPFYTDQLFGDLNEVSGRFSGSLHLADFPLAKADEIDLFLEQKMTIAQQVTSLVLALRKKENLKVRQPLQKIMIPVPDERFREQLRAVEELILSELNVKELEYLDPQSGVLVKQIKPNFKTLGPRYGKHMKSIAAAVGSFSQDDILRMEQEGRYELVFGGEQVVLESADVEISSQDVPGWLVASSGGLTVALDITLTPSLREEGLAREVVNRIQNLRKDRGLDVTDKISVEIQRHAALDDAINHNFSYICSETLASSLELVDSPKNNGVEVEVDEKIRTRIALEKVN